MVYHILKILLLSAYLFFIILGDILFNQKMQEYYVMMWDIMFP